MPNVWMSEVAVKMPVTATPPAPTTSGAAEAPEAPPQGPRRTELPTAATARIRSSCTALEYTSPAQAARATRASGIDERGVDEDIVISREHITALPAAYPPYSPRPAHGTSAQSMKSVQTSKSPRV